MTMHTLEISTRGEGFIEITAQVRELVEAQKIQSGVVVIQNTHTSCGLTINEAYDPSAKADLVNFLKHLAPENLKFIEHTDEGPDDSPSHMKALLVQPTLNLILEQGKLQLGQWQGIYLCEFRRAPKTRRLLVKIIAD